MYIVVFGASGKIGQLLIPLLIKDGHIVTAFVHSTVPFAEDAHLKIIKGDIHDEADIVQALKGQELVMSTLGSWHTKSKDILSSAVELIVPLMQKNGQKRIITLTGSGARVTGDNTSLFESISHYAITLIAGKIIRDAEDHNTLLEQSSLDYVIVRSPVMNDRSTETYKLNDTAPGALETTSRSSVVAALRDLVSSSQFNRSAPYIHQK